MLNISGRRSSPSGCDTGNHFDEDSGAALSTRGIRHVLSPLDIAIQAGTAVEFKATAFITNDPAFERIPDFKTILLERCA